ncbi:MAG: hypothetical protein RMJ60_00520 [Anaerolineales bacterium]|nr:hypothetical protein [Anaerolineales bacterium]
MHYNSKQEFRMVFEVRDYYDFVRLLHEHPEWQEELRRLVLTREILD